MGQKTNKLLSDTLGRHDWPVVHRLKKSKRVFVGGEYTHWDVECMPLVLYIPFISEGKKIEFR